MTTVIQNILRVGDRKTAGKQIHYAIYLLLASYVNRASSFPVPNSQRQIGSIPLLSGKYWNRFEAISYSQEDKSSSSKGDITSEVTNTVSFVLGGMSTALYDFLENYQGELFYIVIQDMESGTKYLLGRELTPYIFQTFERVNGKDSRSCTLTFGNSSFDMPLIYTGALTTEAVTEMTADATALAITSAREYKTSASNTQATALATVSGLTTADEDRIIVITGGGGTYPTTIPDGSVFVLRGGTTWTGNAGASISFRIMDTSTLVEVTRS